MACRPELTLCVALFLLSCPAPIFADKLHITSNPSGATVELDGVAVGATPFEKEFPGGYFHKTRTSMGSRLEHPVVARISLTGYASKELKLTQGPMNWISLNGRNRGEYWLLKPDHFHVDLQPSRKPSRAASPPRFPTPPSAFSHAVILKFPGHADWRRTLEVLKSSKVSLKANLEPGS